MHPSVTAQSAPAAQRQHLAPSEVPCPAAAAGGGGRAPLHCSDAVVEGSRGMRLAAAGTEHLRARRDSGGGRKLQAGKKALKWASMRTEQFPVITYVNQFGQHHWMTGKVWDKFKQVFSKRKFEAVSATHVFCGGETWRQSCSRRRERRRRRTRRRYYCSTLFLLTSGWKETQGDSVPWLY